MGNASIIEKINKSALNFLIPVTPEETYPIIVNEALKLTSSEFGSILLRDKRKLKRVYGSNKFAYSIRNRIRGNTYIALRERKTVVASVSETVKAHPQLRKVGIKKTIFIPLSYQNKSMGVLTVSTKKDIKFSKDELDALKLFGSLATLAIRKSQLHSELSQALESRDFFIAVAAHEFRTPLTTINGYAQLLNKNLRSEKECEWSGSILEETKRLTELVNDLLVVNKISTGKLELTLTECSLRDLIERSMVNFNFTYRRRKIIFTDLLGKAPDKVVGDCDKLVGVFTDLLENAAKFSDNDTNVTVILWYKSPHLIITIKDQGRGVEKKDLKRVFDVFYKTHSNDEEEGMGMGLFLAKNIIESLNGYISIFSKRNIGTTIQIKLKGLK